MLANSISKQIACCISAVFYTCQLTQSSCTIECTYLGSGICIYMLISSLSYKISSSTADKNCRIIYITSYNCITISSFYRLGSSSYSISICINSEFQQFIIAEDIVNIPVSDSTIDNFIGFILFCVINIEFGIS